MNKIFRSISVTCILSLLMTLFIGCSTSSKAPSSSSSSTSTATEKAEQGTQEKAREVKLRFAWWGGDTRHQATLAAIDAYTKKYPNVKIDAEYMGFNGYEKKLLTQFAGDVAPDLFQNVAAWYPDISTENYADLNKYENIIDLKQFNESLLEECTYNEKLQALPTGVQASVMMYNKDLFGKFGIAEDTVWNWDKVLEVGKKVHAEDQEYYLLPAPDLDTINRLILIPYISQKTGDIFIHDDYTMAFDKPVLVDALKYLQDLFTTGALAPISVATATMQNDPNVVKGKVGLSISFTGTVINTKALNPDVHWGVTQIPMLSDAKDSANPVRSGVTFSINAKSQELDESAKFLNWILNDQEAALILTQERGVPASDIARNTLADNNKIDPLIAQALEIANKNPGKRPNAVSENAEIWQISKDVITALSMGKTTPEKGADTIIKQCAAKLKELKAAAEKK